MLWWGIRNIHPIFTLEIYLFMVYQYSFFSVPLKKFFKSNKSSSLAMLNSRNLCSLANIKQTPALPSKFSQIHVSLDTNLS